MNIRKMEPVDYPILEDFLYHAIFVSDGEEVPDRGVIYEPGVCKYIESFGQKDDFGVVAEVDGKIAAMAWVRIIGAYGYIDDATPELAISVLPEHRNLGIGAKLMMGLFDLLTEAGYRQTSLAVQKENPAVNFYQRLGYEVVNENSEEFIMVKTLQSSWRIECGNAKDVEDLERLYDALNDHLAEGFNWAGWKKGVYPTKEEAETGIEEETLFVLRMDDQIAGSVILNHIQEEAYSEAEWQVEAKGHQVMVLRVLVTHPDFMNQGVSRRLLTFAKEHALSQGCKSLRLDVAIQNKPAIVLYEKCGFVHIGTVDLGLPYDHLKWFRLYEFVLGGK